MLDRSYDAQLAQRVIEGSERPLDAAFELFERNDPRTLHEATALVWPEGGQPRRSVDAFERAWDRYRHVRDMPCA